MSIDPIYSKSSGMAGINRFERFSIEELEMLIGVIRLFDPFLGFGDPNAEEKFKEHGEQQRKRASELFGEMVQARCEKEQLAKPTSPEYPCPKCHRPGVYCGCSSSCRHDSNYGQRYCNHCREYFSASSSCVRKEEKMDSLLLLEIKQLAQDREYCEDAGSLFDLLKEIEEKIAAGESDDN